MIKSCIKDRLGIKLSNAGPSCLDLFISSPQHIDVNPFYFPG